MESTIRRQSLLVASEARGIATIPPGARRIYSVGISSFANAELAMAEDHPEARIIATTIDAQGLKATERKLAGHPRIECRLEDVREPLPYPDAHFDFIYARLVLHYLTPPQAQAALRELRRALTPGAGIYLVVRSVNEWELGLPSASCDLATRMTTYPVTDPAGRPSTITRRFYSQEQLAALVEDAGLAVDWCEELDETLYKDFERTVPTAQPNTLVLLRAHRPEDEP